MLREYVYHLKDLGLSPASIRRNVSAIRTYFRFLIGDGIVVRDPSERLETPKRWRELPDVLSVDEVKRLIAAPTLDDNMVFRDRALLELAYGAGLRVSEWITLGVRDLLLEEGLVRVFGKGSKERLVPIGRSAIGAVAVYLRELRPKLEKGEGKGILFLNARGRPLTRMGAWKILRGYVERAGITKHVIAAHPSPLLRDASARGGRRPPRGPGDARPCGHLDDADLYPCRSGVSSTGPSELSSARLIDRPSSSARPISACSSSSTTTTRSRTTSSSIWASWARTLVVRRNDAVTVEEVGALAPAAIVLSPGPCAPAQAGVTVDVIRAWGATIADPRRLPRPSGHR